MNSIYLAASIARDIHKDDTINGKHFFIHRVLKVVEYIQSKHCYQDNLEKMICVGYLSDVLSHPEAIEDALMQEFSDDIANAVQVIYNWNIHEIRQSEDMLVRCVFEAICRVEMDEYISVADFETAKYYLNCLCLMESVSE